MKLKIILFFFFIHYFSIAQYTMQDLTVTDCEGSLTDSESNSLNPSWYSHNENFNFTICPLNVLQIQINFSLFSTEPSNDYIIIYDGPDNTYPIIGGPYSGSNLPPQITSNGCVTIEFISDQNVADEGFQLSWNSLISQPQVPLLTIPSNINCSTSVVTVQLDRNIHCDSVITSNYNLGGQLNQNILPNALNCINDSTNLIELNLLPGLNESGIYNLSIESSFIDDCDSIWQLTSDIQFSINDCPIQVDIISNDTIICLGDCVDLYASVSGGDSLTYNYNWNPLLPSTAGPHNVCPTSTTQYIVNVNDNGPSQGDSDTILITVVSPPQTQNNITICQNSNPIILTANPPGGSWYGNGIINSSIGLFNPNILNPGIYNVDYNLFGCNDNLQITLLEIYAGEDISVCPNAPIFNLNSSNITAGGFWTGMYTQSNGDVLVGSNPVNFEVIYTLLNGCSDTINIDVSNISIQPDDTLCQNQGDYPISFSPQNGIWNMLPSNPLQNSLCPNSINDFPYIQNWEVGFSNWLNDPNNDFDWVINNGSTPSANTGPDFAFDGLNYIYTEASSPNYPEKISSIISPCINISEYSNPVLNFWHHKYGTGQGDLSIDISIDNGNTWQWNVFYISGDLGNQWNQESINLSNFISSELRIRIRVKTGNDWQSDVAIDRLSILSGPITPSGIFLSDVSNYGIYNLIYSIEGCDEYLNLFIKEINAGDDRTLCPSENIFNIIGSPNGGFWSGNNIINSNSGSYDPSMNLGYDVITYSYNSCIDTAIYNVLETNLQIDSLFLCSNIGNQTLDMNLVPRVPWHGTFYGAGIVDTSHPGTFNPVVSGSGIHTLYYTSNTCTDSLIVNVFPQSVLSDTLICNNSPDIILNINPSGGLFGGNGILDNNLGVFSPSSLNIGNHMIGYQSLDGCIDTFNINIYQNPILSFNGFENYYCNKDTNIQINALPNGGVFSGNGIINDIFNPAVAGSGYHNIKYSYGLNSCEISIDTIIFVENELVTSIYSSKDTICADDLVSVGVNISGGVPNYSFSWNNINNTSFEQLVNLDSTFNFIVTSSDGCSDNNIDSILIVVHPKFSFDYTTSEIKCFGELGYAKLLISDQNNYSYLWNTNPPSYLDSIYSFVNRNYIVLVTDDSTNCVVSDTIWIPGYNELYASFYKNIYDCISVIDAEIQFLDASIIDNTQISLNSYWDFGDDIIIPYNNLENPIHTYSDTGIYFPSLFLENIGGCKDTFSSTVCIYPETKIFIPNSFTPNNDYCNDNFYLIGKGDFSEFNIKIYSRWGGDIIFESNEVIFIDNYLNESNICNSSSYNKEYYKMGNWNGLNTIGEECKQGVYVYIVKYKSKNDKSSVEHYGEVNLIR